MRIGHYVQQKLGKMVGVSPERRMKTALELARPESCKLLLSINPSMLLLKKFLQRIDTLERKDVLPGANL